MRQVLLYVKDWIQPGDPRCGAVPKALPIKVAEQPHRIWTLFRNERETPVPTLPFNPQHRGNAFAEDRIHDWDWRDGMLRYYSRVADRPVWILLEYKS